MLLMESDLARLREGAAAATIVVVEVEDVDDVERAT